MVTVALEMHIIMQGGEHPQAAGACYPLSLSTGAGHHCTPCPHALLLSYPPLCSLLHAPQELGWCGLGLSLTGQVKVGDVGCSRLLPAECLTDDGSGGTTRQWELCAGHKWAIGGMGPLGWVGRAPPVSWPGKLQAEKAAGSPNSSPLPALLRWKQQLETTNIERDFCLKSKGQAPAPGTQPGAGQRRDQQRTQQRGLRFPAAEQQGRCFLMKPEEPKTGCSQCQPLLGWFCTSVPGKHGSCAGLRCCCCGSCM